MMDHRRMRAALAALALLVTAACSRDKPAPAEAVKPAAVATPAVASSSGAGGAFGAFCVDDGACASSVCFHKRLKTEASGPERRGGGDALEHDGYCSMRCDTDADCPSPPSSGRCGARGMCKRPES
jgi:hypothetical protein